MKQIIKNVLVHSIAWYMIIFTFYLAGYFFHDVVAYDKYTDGIALILYVCCWVGFIVYSKTKE